MVLFGYAYIAFLTIWIFLSSSRAHSSQFLSEDLWDSKRSAGTNDIHEVPEGWISAGSLGNDIKWGQVSGVSLDDDSNVYVFHRVDRYWGMNTFNINNNVFREISLGPILEPTILIFNKNGTLVKSRGKEMFYMPHGITVDHLKNIWVTDVALHQVMKLSPTSDSPLLTLGEKFVPGRDSIHFCKPTSVAVSPTNGDFFVADGYCNSRILKYNYNGVKILEWGRSTVHGNRVLGHGEFDIPHALTLIEEKQIICTADRQNGRVQCFDMNNSSFITEISNYKMFGTLIFSAAYSPAKGGLLYLVNGDDGTAQVQGFVVSLDGAIVAKFGPKLQTPHDIAVSSDGRAIYVAEIDPFKLWKFVPNDSLILNIPPPKIDYYQSLKDESSGKLAGAILITSSCLIFAGAIIIAAFIYSRSKKPGCGHCRNNRWLLNNGNAEGFKLANILGHQGFEKLNTGEETDEEQPLA